MGLVDGLIIVVECDLCDLNWDLFVFIEDLIIFDNCVDFGDLIIIMEDELVEEGECGVFDFKSIWCCIWMVMDFCDNIIEYILFICIVDIQGLEWIFFLVDVGIECDEVVFFEQVIVQDVCLEVEVSYEDDIIFGDCFNNYIICCCWIVIDGCGNLMVDD